MKGDVSADGVGEYVADVVVGLFDETEPALGLSDSVVPAAGIQPHFCNRPVVEGHT